MRALWQSTGNENDETPSCEICDNTGSENAIQ